MHCAESLEGWLKHNQEMLARMLVATAHRDEKALNTTPDVSLWSPAQIVEHLVLTNRPYLRAIADVLQIAAHVPEDPLLRYTFIGGLLCKAAGPDGNVPAPKALHPRTTSIPITVVQEWQQQQIELMALINQSTGVDLSRTRVWNPLVKIIPMNLADCFAILTAHTERHLRQIEQRLPAAS
ncbi:MAG: hypothetical protein JWN14_4174 [Chthonomonadales bacterium]|nr:hypothetical protein [Chthonomonadales bacterium]